MTCLLLSQRKFGTNTVLYCTTHMCDKDVSACESVPILRCGARDIPFVSGIFFRMSRTVSSPLAITLHFPPQRSLTTMRLWSLCHGIASLALLAGVLLRGCAVALVALAAVQSVGWGSINVIATAEGLLGPTRIHNFIWIVCIDYPIDSLYLTIAKGYFWSEANSITHL